MAQYLGRDERVVLETRQHPFAIVRAFVDAVMLLVPLLLVVWGLAGIAAFRNQLGSWLTFGAFLVMAWVVGRLAWRILEWELARLVVSTEKLVHVHGVLHRRISSASLVKVSDLTVSQPLVGRIFGYGSLVVDTPGGGEAPIHGLSYIPEPAAVYRLIADTARRERAFEGGADVLPPPADLPPSADTTTVLRPPGLT
jgi:uncharacterized membrane protein YdbT with pleckstrin-like domain